ncbi:hypothetical protein B1A_12195, partial [mine drainage metagenome]
QMSLWQPSGREPPPQHGRTIPAAYTNTGMRRIFEFLTEVQAASPPNFPIALHEQSFLAWYRIRKEEAWLGFLQSFQDGDRPCPTPLPGRVSSRVFRHHRIPISFSQTGCPRNFRQARTTSTNDGRIFSEGS